VANNEVDSSALRRDAPKSTLDECAEFVGLVKPGTHYTSVHGPWTRVSKNDTARG